MAKQNKAKKSNKVVGTGKVTPVQIAFILDRYLADNNFTNTLAAFRVEAHNLFSKTKGKEAPKGLLGLADILDEYISLKEKRVVVDQEKQRVETALQGIQEVMRGYLSSEPGAVSLYPSSPPLYPPHVVAEAPMTPFYPMSNPSYGSLQGQTVHGTALMSNPQPPMLLPKAGQPSRFPTPIPNSSSAMKRKPSKPAPMVPSSPKKSRTQTPLTSSITEGKTSPSQTDSYSPMTPPLVLPSQVEKLASPPESSSSSMIISSETIIVSPLKRTGYFSVERSYHVTSSPFKPSPSKQRKGDNVKGRLLFDEPGASIGSEVSVVSSSSSSNEEAQDAFDFDLSEFDIFNGDILFSDILGDIDIDSEELPSISQPDDPTHFANGLEHNAEKRCIETNQDLSGSSLSTPRRLLPGNTHIQGSDSMTSMTTITKCIQILSPVKVRSNCS